MLFLILVKPSPKFVLLSCRLNLQLTYLFAYTNMTTIISGHLFNSVISICQVCLRYTSNCTICITQQFLGNQLYILGFWNFTRFNVWKGMGRIWTFSSVSNQQFINVKQKNLPSNSYIHYQPNCISIKFYLKCSLRT